MEVLYLQYTFSMLRFMFNDGCYSLYKTNILNLLFEKENITMKAWNSSKWYIKHFFQNTVDRDKGDMVYMYM